MKKNNKNQEEGKSAIHHMHDHDHSSHEEHNKHAGHSLSDFKKRFYISLFLTIPILLLSPLIQQWAGWKLAFYGDRLVLLFLATLIFFYGGNPFLLGAYSEIKNKAIGMMTLITLAISVAYFYSFLVTVGLAGEIFFWELATLIDIMLLGHWLEMKSVMGASMALEKLSSLIPSEAHFKKGDQIVDIPISSLQRDNIVLVKPGEKIPIDGLVIKGESFVNEAMLTGEAEPVFKKTGAKVIGGSIVEEGALEIQVNEVGEGTYLSKVIRLVKEAQNSKSKTQLLADKSAFWLTFMALAVGLITFVIWLIIDHNLAFAIERMATVLIVACPHALGLAIPLVASISNTLAAKNGLLIKNRIAFENTRKITTVIFDKTGTLTEGLFSVKSIYSFSNYYDRDIILQIMDALERNSEHPIAKAIAKEAEKKQDKKLEISNFKALRGKGVEAIIENKKFILASPGYLRELKLSFPSEIKEGEQTVVFLVVEEKENKLIGAVTLSDVIRQESYSAVSFLKKHGFKVWMLTGDNENSAKMVAQKLDLDGFFFGVLPHEKQEKVKKLQEQGEFVAMVGDGINDAPALAQADVGIAIGSGTDIAAETADIILVNSNPQDINSLISFGQATYKKMLQNLWWAAGYNLVAIPLAAGILSPWGIVLSPAVGAILMSLSTVIVAINAQKLKIRK